MLNVRTTIWDYYTASVAIPEYHGFQSLKVLSLEDYSWKTRKPITMGILPAKKLYDFLAATLSIVQVELMSGDFALGLTPD